MQQIINILIIVFIISFASCKKSYTNADIQNAPAIVVVEGLLTDLNGPYQIKLSEAPGYNTGLTSNTAISGAIVTITEDGSYCETLKEKSAGIYETSVIKGKIGHTYKLQFTLADGSVYESPNCLMPITPHIDSLYTEVGKSVYIINQGITDTVDGINVYADVSSATQSFIQFRMQTIEEKIIYYRGSQTYYMYNETHNDIPNLNTISKNNLTQIKKQLIGFIPRKPLIVDTQFEGSITSAFAYSLPEDAFNFQKKIYDQLNGTNRLFDPIPTQLTGNIICINNKDKKILGFFIVSAVVAKHALLNLNYYDKQIFQKNLAQLSASIPNYKGAVKPTDWVWRTLNK